jgi:hypothetical protein
MNEVMRNLVLGYIALVWGGIVVGYGMTKGLDGSGSYPAGSLAGVAVGFVLLLTGGWILVRRARSD